MPGERRKLQAAAGEARSIAEKAQREHEAECQRMRSYLDDAEHSQSLSPAEVERARAEVDEAERYVRKNVRDTLADIDAQIAQALSLAGNRD